MDLLGWIKDEFYKRNLRQRKLDCQDEWSKCSNFQILIEFLKHLQVSWKCNKSLQTYKVVEMSMDQLPPSITTSYLFEKVFIGFETALVSYIISVVRDKWQFCIPHIILSFQFIMCLYSTCHTLIVIVVTNDSTLMSNEVDFQSTWYLAIGKQQQVIYTCARHI